ncbi:unnamed protein product [Rhizoctonia solani]|uniref:HAT C-terminal dimerisation domain-containing protein n=1 Tax=Rhizoctonia solani TaxID=456999 RepID=A0A8H3DT34_9AGAM|nr:unnamed protein product [Rhizoctonia solani]CAE6538291.1 unnamed protein product [Rhizoctonia solani]
MPLQSLPVINAPPNPLGPLRKRHKDLARFNDIEAWDYDDKGLIAAAKTTWRSDVYEHYITRVGQCSADISSSSTHADTMDRRRILAARRHATPLNITGAAVEGNLDRDTIEAYPDTPTVPSGIINQAGGVLGYWSAEHTNRPRIAQMALDYLTSPASSVDAERAFSCGRLMINHLQHRMSPQTFQAQMAIGFWFGTPLLPNIDSVASIIQDHM